MSYNEKLLRLQQLELRLQGANAVWTEALHLGKRCRFSRHHRIQGDRDSGFFLLTQGSVRASYTACMGQERHFLTIGEGCLFNEVSVLTSGVPGVAFVCMEPVEAWRFSPALLEDMQFCRQYPHLPINLLRSMGRKLNTYFFYLTELRTGTSFNQLCTLLLLISRQRLAISQSELGLMLGLHQTTISRMVRFLRHERVIGRFTKNLLEVLDVQRLCEMAELPVTRPYGSRQPQAAEG